MKKLLLIMILAISVALSGCSSKNDEEVGNAETGLESNSIENQEEEVGKDHIQTEDQEESEDTEKPKKDKLEETAKEIERNIFEKIEGSEEDSEKLAEEIPWEIESEKSAQEKEGAEAPIEEKANGLHIQGKVKNPLSLNLDDLKAMNDIIFKGNFYSLNNFGTRAYTEFKGVNLWSLLKSKAEISDEATKVKIIASDGYEMQFTVEQVKRQDYIDETDDTAKFPMIIAWEENGEEYDLDDGLPFKLVIGQKEPGDVNKPQWVSNIEKILVE